MAKLLELMYEDAKETLVTVHPDGFAAAQANAQTLDRLRMHLTRPSFEESQLAYKPQTTKE